jgi:quercetin dioxygenase-like cupin family protein
VLLDVFAPMGPERVYRDPKDEAGRAAFEVIRGAAPAAPAGAKFTVASVTDALPVFGGKGKIKPLLEPAKTGNKSLYVGILEAEPGAEVPRNTHPGSAEILYVVSGGGGELTVGSEKIPFGAEEALHIPDGQPHAAKFSGAEKTVMVQVFAPGGPEERYRAAQAQGNGNKAKK